MPTSVHVARAGAAEQQLVFGCVPDARARGRLQTALRGHATLRWFTSFDEVRQALEQGERPATALIALSDTLGGTAEVFAHGVREDMTGTPIVVCCDLGHDAQRSVATLAMAGVHDVLFTGMNDEGHAARTVILGAVVGGAGDVVMRAVGPSIPRILMPFVDIAVRRPREIQRVGDVAAALKIPRQTLSRWCREQRFVMPEELLVWARLFVAVALLDSTPRTLESIAAELCYGSPNTLRNRIRKYVGMTATQLRAHGLDLVLTVFGHRIDELRAEAAANVSQAVNRSFK